MEETLFGSLPRYAGAFVVERYCLPDNSNQQIQKSLLASHHVFPVLQVALISFARDVLGIADATSEEFDSDKTPAT